MRLAPKALIGLAVAAALAVAGCGGGGDDTTSASTSTATSQKADAGGQKQKPKPKKNSQGSPSFKQPDVPAPTTKSALPNQGTKAVAPGVPTAKGGDNSIQTFGVETTSADRVQASSTAKAYFNARAAGRWDEACSYLSSPVKSQLEALVKGAHGAAGGCASAMKAFTARVPKGPLLAAAKIHVLSMRVQGSRAFLLYKDGTGTPSELPMNQEDGVWKVSAIAGSALLL